MIKSWLGRVCAIISIYPASFCFADLRVHPTFPVGVESGLRGNAFVAGDASPGDFVGNPAQAIFKKGKIVSGSAAHLRFLGSSSVRSANLQAEFYHSRDLSAPTLASTQWGNGNWAWGFAIVVPEMREISTETPFALYFPLSSGGSAMGSTTLRNVADEKKELLALQYAQRIGRHSLGGMLSLERIRGTSELSYRPTELSITSSSDKLRLFSITRKSTLVTSLTGSFGVKFDWIGSSVGLVAKSNLSTISADRNQSESAMTNLLVSGVETKPTLTATDESSKFEYVTSPAFAFGYSQGSDIGRISLDLELLGPSRRVLANKTNEDELKQATLVSVGISSKVKGLTVNFGVGAEGPRSEHRSSRYFASAGLTEHAGQTVNSYGMFWSAQKIGSADNSTNSNEVFAGIFLSTSYEFRESSPLDRPRERDGRRRQVR